MMVGRQMSGVVELFSMLFLWYVSTLRPTSCCVDETSCVQGALPFDDDNLRVLLEKVKRGHFIIPPYLPQGAQQLLRGMVEVNPLKRMAVSTPHPVTTVMVIAFPPLQLDDVMKHPWFKGWALIGVVSPSGHVCVSLCVCRSHDSSELEPVVPMSDAVETVPLESRTDIDTDVFKSMASLGCFKDRTALAKALLNPEWVVLSVVCTMRRRRKV